MQQKLGCSDSQPISQRFFHRKPPKIGHDSASEAEKSSKIRRAVGMADVEELRKHMESRCLEPGEEGDKEMGAYGVPS